MGAADGRIRTHELDHFGKTVKIRDRVRSGV